MTIREAKESLIHELEMASDSPVFEATELLLATTACDRGRLLYEQDRVLTKTEQLAIKKFLAKRKQGIPLQYILGEWEFYSLPFSVGKGVLIPRADSELLVDLALEELDNTETGVVFDLCAGSGALGISVAHHKPKLRVYLVEKSRRAFGYLKENVARNGVSAEPIRADISRWNPPEKADLILCNPPYITGAEMRELEREVKKEPTLALFGGRDGLKFYRLLKSRAADLLKPEGKLLMEIGWKQGEEVSTLFREAGFRSVEVLQDLSGNDRVVMAGLPEHQ